MPDANQKNPSKVETKNNNHSVIPRTSESSYSAKTNYLAIREKEGAPNISEGKQNIKDITDKSPIKSGNINDEIELLSSQNPDPEILSTQAVSEINGQQLSHFKCSLQLLLSNLFSGSAVLYFGLALPEGLFSAIVTASLNYVQTLMNSRKAVNRYHIYLKNFSTRAITQYRMNNYPPNDIEANLSTTPENNFQKFTIQETVSFASIETLKWYILYSISALQPSLVHQVPWPWFHNKIVTSYLRGAAMVFLEPAVQEQIERCHMLFNKTPVSKIKKHFEPLLEQKKIQLKDSDNINQIDPLIFLLQGDLSSHKRASYLKWLLTSLFLICFLSANSGEYATTYRNTDESLTDRFASILGDMIFGFFTASLAARGLVTKLYNRFYIFIRKERLLAISSVIAIAISTLASSGNISVNKKENFPFAVSVILTTFGATLDNASYLIELIAEFLSHYNPQLNNQQTQKIDDLSFERIIIEAYEKNPALLEPYVAHIKRHLTWATNLSITQTTEIIYSLVKNPQSGNTIIQSLSKRNLLEKTKIISIALIAPLLASSITISTCWIPKITRLNVTAQFLVSYMLPLLAIPLAVSLKIFLTYYENYFQKKINESTPLLHMRSRTNEIIDTKNNESQKILFYRKPLAYSAAQLTLLSILPLLIRKSAETIASFALTYVFKNGYAKYNSEIVANLIAALSSGLITYHINPNSILLVRRPNPQINNTVNFSK